MALGAKAEIWSNGRYQYYEHFLTRGYASSTEPVIHFGLSGNKSADSIRVTWPASGKISLLKNVTANQTIEIKEIEEIEEIEEINRNNLLNSDLLFAECNTVLNYLHEQNDFNDFDLSQKIIPHKFSQIGPRMAKGDIDGDGMEDIIIGSTNKLPTTVLLNKGYKFENTSFEGLTTQKIYSESDLAILDIEGDGDNDIIAVAGGYENRNEADYQHCLYTNNNGTFEKSNLPVPQFPASVVRPCDFDHNGTIDLFIGARVKMGMYPYSNHSWLILNDKGQLKADPLFRLNLGMVTDAIWTDYDNDGWEDLLVAREWNSIVIMKNMGGKELVPQTIPELEKEHGLWYSLAAGDFDMDGDDDYIAGNLGDNHRFTVNDTYPLKFYAIDVDQDGVIDPIMTGYWNDRNNKMTEYPVNYLDELWSQSKYFEAIYKDYTPFSYMSINEILKENLLTGLKFELYVNTTSSYILWNDKGSFRFERLPALLQVSPVKKMIVEDFNDDTYPDVLAAGNDYTYNLSTGYFDANKGVLLLNKVKMQDKDHYSFEALGPSRTGILLQGMVESLLYLKGDTSLVVAGINRAGAVVYKVKK